jgi:predicted MFS family arabinose efflux permease
VRLPAGLTVLRVREFRLLFVGQAVSLIGDGMLIVALSFAVLDLTGSVSDLGFILAAYRAPTLVTVLLGGVVADRVPRRAVMLGADLVRLAAIAVSATLLITGHARLWELAVLMALTGIATGFFYPASAGLLPLLVEPELLQPANGLRGVSQATGAIIGPAIAGVLIATASPGWAIAVDAATFGVSAWSLAFLRLPSHVPLPPQRFWRDLSDGWFEFRSRTWVWVSVLIAGVFGNLLTPAFGVLGPTIARQHLGGASAWAAVLSAQGAGSVFGGLLVLRRQPKRPLVVSSLAWGLLVVPYLLLAFVAPVPVLVVGAFVGGSGLAVGQSLWDTTLQRRIPHRALSRVAAYDVFGSLAFNPVGYALMGPVALAIGTRTTLLIAATWFATSSVALAALPSIRAVRQGDT